MQWDDKAIILSVKRLGESSGLIHLLTPEHGMYGGVDKGAFGSRKRGIYQPGNIVAAHWQARLSEHVGMLTCELAHAVTAHLLDNRTKLAALTSATLMVEKTITEREKHAPIYEHLSTLIDALLTDSDWLASYVRLEFALLEHSGFGLDLNTCASTGQTHDLHYVSPKSGRAVSKEAGMPYHDRLLKLPLFLVSSSLPLAPDLTQILEGVKLCGYFLRERVFAARGTLMPVARARFIDSLVGNNVVQSYAEII
jgi:DNA repair protein RecO (recombination protein O)